MHIGELERMQRDITPKLESGQVVADMTIFEGIVGHRLDGGRILRV